jgi:hypothetical protein
MRYAEHLFVTTCDVHNTFENSTNTVDEIDCILRLHGASAWLLFQRIRFQ